MQLRHNLYHWDLDGYVEVALKSIGPHLTTVDILDQLGADTKLLEHHAKQLSKVPIALSVDHKLGGGSHLLTQTRRQGKLG